MSNLKFLLFAIIIIGPSLVLAQQWTGTGGTGGSIGSLFTNGWVAINGPGAQGSWPNTTLHVRDGSFLVENNSGSNVSQNFDITNYTQYPGVKFYYNMWKKAFRGGEITGNQWNNANVAPYSFAYGYNVTASNSYSVSLGNSSTASGSSSLAVGSSSLATGTGAVALGVSSSATQTGAFAAGNSIANGFYSASLNGATAGANYSAALNGAVTGANANYAAAVNKAWADGAFSFASGNSYTAGQYSTAFGSSQTGANANYSLACGYLSGAYGSNSIALGSYIDANGQNSMVLGAGTSNKYFENGIPNSLMIGFNSTLPSVFVGPASTNNSETRFGYVGIGTTTPQSELAVNGTVTTKVLIVDPTPADWPDYVFDKDYKLMSFQEIEKYIAEHKHLPGVASAKEVEDKGINVGEMSRVMIEKLEELTLHLISLKKENDALRKVVEELKNR